MGNHSGTSRAVSHFFIHINPMQRLHLTSLYCMYNKLVTKGRRGWNTLQSTYYYINNYNKTNFVINIEYGRTHRFNYFRIRIRLIINRLGCGVYQKGGI